MASRTLLATAVVIVLGCGIPAAVGAQERPVVMVLVRNDAHVKARVLRRARHYVTDLLGAAGVSAIWSGGEAGAGYAAARLDIVITPKLPEAATRDRDVLGLTPESEAGPGHLAYVLWDHIEALADSDGRDPAPLLAYAMVHEIGHLLLGAHSHAASGIMRGNWDRATLTLSDRGLLRFTAEQAARIRARLEAKSPTLLATREGAAQE